MNTRTLFFILFISIFVFSDSVFSQNDPPQSQAIPVKSFLNSMGAVSSVSRRGESLEATIKCLKYAGLNWLRVGYEDNAPVSDFIQVHKETGVLFSYGLLSGHTDIERLIKEAKQLANEGALLALEGLNEPNNWGITYQGEKGGGRESWLPVAKLQRDLYSAVKNDPDLKHFPVWSLSEGGAQTDRPSIPDYSGKNEYFTSCRYSFCRLCQLP